MANHDRVAGRGRGSWWRSTAAGVLAVLACAVPPSAASAQDLTGLWLIEPDSFDVYVERGFDVPHYPVLAIGEDHAFRLYRVGTECVPVDAEGVDIGYRQRGEPCHHAATVNARDGLGTSARVVAEGRWEQLSDGRVQFMARSVAAVPKWWRDQVQPVIRSGRRPERMSVRDWRRIEDAEDTYYTTFYVGDGAPMAASRGGDVLTFTAATGRELRYRRVSGAALSRAGDVLTTFELYATPFRCVLGAIEGGGDADARDREELDRVVALAARVSAGSVLSDYAAILFDTGREGEARRVWSAAGVEAYHADRQAAQRHPLNSSESAAAAFFGCARPERRR